MKKIRPVGAVLFHADGRTGKTTLIVAFRNFSKAPKNEFRQLIHNIKKTCKKKSTDAVYHTHLLRQKTRGWGGPIPLTLGLKQRKTG